MKSFSETFSGFTSAGEDGCDALSYDVVVNGEKRNFLGLSIDTFMADSQDPWDYAFSWRCVDMEQDTLQIQLTFSNPEQISSSYNQIREYDLLRIDFNGFYYIQDYFGNILVPGERRVEIPPQAG